MLEYGYITSVDGSTEFMTTTIPMYQFYEDREDLAANMIRQCKEEVGEALDVSVELVKMIEEVYREAIVEVDFQTKIIAERALISRKYEQYISNASKLEKVKMSFYSIEEAYCFFLNVYQ